MSETFADRREARDALAALKNMGFRSHDLGIMQTNGDRLCAMSLRRMSRQTARAGTWLFGALGAMIATVATAVEMLTAGAETSLRTLEAATNGINKIALFTASGAVLGWLLGRLTRQPPLFFSAAPDESSSPLLRPIVVFVKTDDRERAALARRILRRTRSARPLGAPVPA